MDFILFTGALAAILAFYLIKLIPKNGSKYKGAPEASGAWPMIGHLNLFGGSSDLPHVTLAAMAVKSGPIFTVRLGVKRLLVVSSRHIAKEIFTTHDASISSRPQYLASKILGYNGAQFNVAPYGPYWREMRRIISLELLSNRRLEQLKHVRMSELKKSIKDMYEVWREKKDGKGKVLVEMKKWFGEFNMNLVVRMVVGKRYNGAGDTNDEDEKEMNRIREVMSRFFHFMGMFLVADRLPFLRWLDLGGYEKAMKETAQEIDSMATIWLHEHRKKKHLEEATEEKDFMDVMISAVESGGLAEYDADTVIKATCMVLIASITDTITVMLTWTLCLLLNNPHVLKKAQEEIDEIVGKVNQVNESDIANLVYIQAIVKETLRLYPSGRLGGRRMFSEDCIVAGYHIPKGTWLMVNLCKLQQDPEIWSNPSEFRPERFLDGSHENVDVKGKNFEFIPFGAGRRSCPGTALALSILHMVVATLVHNFNISTPDDMPVDMAETAGLSTSKTSPLEVLISPRIESNRIY